jgi:hypothetical protein
MDMSELPTPETDAFIVQITTNEGPTGVKWRGHAERLERERDELAALLAAEKATRNSIIEKGVKTERERDEAREQIKELIYISERAIDLAEIDFENDKFGVVSELRDGLERIKEGAKCPVCSPEQKCWECADDVSREGAK